MGIKSSKPRLLGTPSRRDSSAISSTARSDKDELQGVVEEVEEDRAQRVGLLCQLITESNKVVEIEDYMEELRELCGEMTAHLYALTELQETLINEAEKVIYATAKAMILFPDDDSITISSLEIFQLMEMTGWEGKRGASQQAQQVIRVLECILHNNQENPNSTFSKADMEKIRLCTDIIRNMETHHREELIKTKCSTILLQLLTAIPTHARTELSSVAFLLAEKLAPQDDEKVFIERALKLLLDDGVTICDITKRRWSDDNSDNFVSPLLEVLLDQGATDINFRCATTGKTALIIACESRQIGLIKYLLDKGADIETSDANGMNALLTALKIKSLTITKLFLDRGAKVDSVDAEKNTALHWAVMVNDPALVNVILEKCVANSENNGSSFSVIDMPNALGLTPIHLTVWQPCVKEKKSLEILQLLVKAGANINLLGPAGASTLILAVHRQKQVETLRAIVEAGCDLTVQCQSMTALDVAKEEGYGDEELKLLTVQ